MSVSPDSSAQTPHGRADPVCRSYFVTTSREQPALPRRLRACEPMRLLAILIVLIVGQQTTSCGYEQPASTQPPARLFARYCQDCHDDQAAGGLDLVTRFRQSAFDPTLIFENIATGKMPPADADQPTGRQRQTMLQWLAEQQQQAQSVALRRLSRQEFVHSVNDLLGTQLDLANELPEDRGTRTFDSDHRIQLSREMLGGLFRVADRMLDHALPDAGFVTERTWVTSKLKDSHETYNIYVRDFREGVLCSWTRANNGDSYSFFYDNFEPPAAGWYELTLEAAKIGDFEGDISVQLHAGRYFYADDRPQPQRLLDVLSVGNRQLTTHTVRAFLKPGDNISVHCYSPHNFREQNPERGAYLRQLTARGPLQDEWPPSRCATLFGDLPVQMEVDGTVAAGPVSTEPEKGQTQPAGYQSRLQRIGGSVRVSSFQAGREPEKMLDGSHRTFWHTQFTPTLATPPHFVIFENPQQHAINGLTYATWSGGNGNGQVEKYEVYTSSDAENWGKPIVQGDLETRLASEQLIHFPTTTTGRFIKFLVSQSFSLDGRSLASIGRLDVLTSSSEAVPRTVVSIASSRDEDLHDVLRRFARRAFATPVGDSELQPYFDVATQALHRDGHFIQAAKAGFKAIICSHRFLMVRCGQCDDWGVPPAALAAAQKAALARILWRSIPDDRLRSSTQSVREQIAWMMADPRSDRLIESLCQQWLNLRSWNRIAPSLKLYPQYDDLLDHYLPLETHAYLAHLMRENQPVRHLIDSNYAFLNQRLADHYGISGVTGQHLRKVSLPPESRRGGLLTMGSILKVTTDGFDTSPILRGAWISKNIVGTPISPPPESVPAIKEAHAGTAASLRELIEQHKSSDTCYACHRSIDPYGFALEHFDATGRWRDRYRVETPHRGTFQYRAGGYYQLAAGVDAAGEINGQTFADITDLKRLLLADSRRVAYHFSKTLFHYANGCQPNLKQRLALLKMTDGRECRLQDLLTDVLVYSLCGEAK